MPTVDSVPKGLRPYTFHGVLLNIAAEGEQARGECPLCGKEGHFHVNPETGLWDCKKCNESGNPVTFLRKLWEVSDGSVGDIEGLVRNRGLLFNDTPQRWGVCRSPITNDWLIPGYNAALKLSQLYRYHDPSSTNNGAVNRPIPTPGELGHAIHGGNLFDPKKGTVYLCEGPWDAMALWETLRITKRTESGELEYTTNEKESLLADSNVLAVPGCNVFFDSWTDFFSAAKVILLFDNDHPGKETRAGKEIPPAGWAGMKRVTQILSRAEEPPAVVLAIRWGEEGYDLSLPSGYDVRDALKSGRTPLERVARLGKILEKVQPIPESWLAGRSFEQRKKGGVELECLPCEDWQTLSQAWKRAMKWIDGLDRALSVMLACITSTRAVGDQLWVKIIGPAACGKSTLCEAISVSRKYVIAKSTIRGFHSGFQSDKEGVEDNSLVTKVADKTLVTKDGDTLLQSPNLEQILAEARDLYDCTSRTHYRNKMGRDYQGIRMTWILCGTSSLRQLDSSELGERFFDCVIMESIDDEMEDEILWRLANRANRNMDYEANGQHDTQHDPEMVRAYQLTGGYVNYLRGNANELLRGVTIPDEMLNRCISLGKFVAYMRARPSKKQEESAERELASRLVSQMVRLAKCLAVVLNRKEVDEGVMKRVRAVALDTARGRTLETMKYLYEKGEKGVPLARLVVHTGYSAEKERAILTFLRKIGAVESYQVNPDAKAGAVIRVRWRLTPRLRKIYDEVVKLADNTEDEARK